MTARRVQAITTAITARELPAVVPLSIGVSSCSDMERVIAYFLPQFFSTPENDRYWGEGFTEWTNVRNAKPRFEGHKQPLAPAFGYYDLSRFDHLRSVASEARGVGVDGFAYWHYWFGSDAAALRDIPETHLSSGIENEFFFAWDNKSWTTSWVGGEDVIFAQEYSDESACQHYEYLRPFLEDQRYVRIDGQPTLQVNHAHQQGAQEHMAILEQLLWHDRRERFHWLWPVAKRPARSFRRGRLHSLVGFPPGDVLATSPTLRVQQALARVRRSMGGPRETTPNGPVRVSQDRYVRAFRRRVWIDQTRFRNYLPCALSGWDNTPRYGTAGTVIEGQIDELLRRQLAILRSRPSARHPFLLVKAWNEWAEGNILEPYAAPSRSGYPGRLLRAPSLASASPAALTPDEVDRLRIV
jgi:hypothetical protein